MKSKRAKTEKTHFGTCEPNSTRIKPKIENKIFKYLPDCLCHRIFSAAHQNGNFVLFFSFKFSLAQFVAKMAKTLLKMAKIFKIFT